MILSKQYDRLMDHIQVTPEMADRILEKLEHVQRRKHTSRYWAAGLAAAACLLLVMGLPFFRHTPLPEIQTTPVRPDMQLISGVESADSSEELSQLVGFQVPSIPELPFEPQEIVYSSYWNKMAQITCSGAENTVVLRMTPGTEDCSRDYTEYAVRDKLEVKDLSITLKGQEEDSFQLAVWSDGEYSYSIKMNQGISTKQWEEILLSFSNA